MDLGVLFFANLIFNRFGLILDAFWIDFGSILSSFWMHFGVRGAFGTPGQRRWAWSEKRARGIEFFLWTRGRLWDPLAPTGSLWASLGVLVLHFGVLGPISS